MIININTNISFLLIIIILILITTITCQFINYYNENFKEYDFYTNCEDYRFGDVFYGRLKNKKGEIEGKILNDYPNSICSKYIKKRTKDIDFDTLFKILNENENTNEIVNENNCVIHIRLGDILDDPFYENDKNKINQKLYHNYPPDNQQYPNMIKYLYNDKIHDRVDNSNYYLKSIDYYNNVIKKLKENNIKNVTIIAGSHINCKNYKLSSYVFNTIKNLFKKNGFNVKINVGGHPDNDLLLVVNSKYYVASNGGYSNLLADIARIKKNKVIKN